MIEFIIALVAFVWMIAMLGFADEGHRKAKANYKGKFLVLTTVLVALAPLAVLMRSAVFYFFGDPFEVVSIETWSPLLATMVSIPVCLWLVKRYDASYKR